MFGTLLHTRMFKVNYDQVAATCLPEVCYHCGRESQLPNNDTIKELESWFRKVRPICCIYLSAGKESTRWGPNHSPKRKTLHCFDNTIVFSTDENYCCVLTIVEFLNTDENIVFHLLLSIFIPAKQVCFFFVFISSIKSVKKSLTGFFFLCIFLLFGNFFV